MDEEIELISDGDGLAVIGEPEAVERFLVSEGLPTSRDLDLHRIGSALQASAGAMQVGSQVAANSGRWVKLTSESAAAVKRYGLMKGSTPGVSRGVVYAKGQAHGIKGLVEFQKGAGSLVTNPAILTGAAGVMAQLAMQQTISEITDYLATIDEKVDDILRAQKDTVLSELIGVGDVIEEAMTIRTAVGRVGEVTWSKVQATTLAIAKTQAYALLRLDALAEKLEKKQGIGELRTITQSAEANTKEWLAVLARCCQLQDAAAVLELDRVLDGAPGDLEQHRVGLRAAREKRLGQISRSTERLLTRIDTAAAAGRSNWNVLHNSSASHSVVDSSNRIANDVLEFCRPLGIESNRDSMEAKGWLEAAGAVRNKAVGAGADGVDQARAAGKKFSSGLRAFRQAMKNDDPD